MATTPNMDLNLPTPGVGGTPGPEWASDVNENFETLDAHDHATVGVPIVSAGININGDLPFNGHDATSVRSVRFENQAVALTEGSDLGIIYAENGELTYRDLAGNKVPITASGSVAGATGSIAGLSSPAAATFSSATDTFSWVYDTAKAARMAFADIALYPYDGSTSFSNLITVKTPAALAANYTITLPLAVPTQTALVGMTTSGVLFTGAPSGTVSAPGMAFSSDLDTGFYTTTSGRIDWAANGVQSGTLGSGGVTTVSSSAPSYTFNTDSDTGVANPSANVLSLVTGGTARFTIDSSSARMPIPLRLAGGTVSAPDFSFNGDEDTGVYQIAGNTLGFTAGGVEAARLTATAATFAGSLAATTGTFSGAIQTASGGAFKVKLVTIGTSSATTVTLSVAHGLTASSIRMVLGSFNQTGTVFGPSFVHDNFNATCIYYTDSTHVYAEIANFISGASRTFYAVIIFV